MRFKLFMTALMSLWAYESGAQIISSELSFRPAFMSTAASTSIKGYEISHQSDLNLNKSQTLYELYGAVYINSAAIKGYYLFPKTVSGDGLLTKLIVDTKAKEDLLPVSTNYTLSGGRVELAIPLRINKACLLEPTIAYQAISQNLNITGDNYNYTDAPRLSSFGIGLELTENFTDSDALNAKFLVTANTSLFSVKYRRNDKRGFIGVGYDWWNIDTPNMKTRMNGPVVEVGVKF